MTLITIISYIPLPSTVYPRFEGALSFCSYRTCIDYALNSTRFYNAFAAKTARSKINLTAVNRTQVPTKHLFIHATSAKNLGHAQRDIQVTVRMVWHRFCIAISAKHGSARNGLTAVNRAQASTKHIFIHTKSAQNACDA